MTDELSAWSPLTRLIHEGERAPAPIATPTATPIYTTATYLYQSAAELDAAFANDKYVYARYGNPTVEVLERVMTVAEGGVGAVTFGSGMAALHAAILTAGTPRGETNPQVRSIVASRDLYGSSTTLLQQFFAAQGTKVTCCDSTNHAAFEQALTTAQPDVVLVESMSNPLLTIADIETLVRLTRAAGARLIVDSTLLSPILQRPLTLGADLVVHSATKYLGGHSDVTGGIVVARTRLLQDTLRRYSKLLGAILGPFEAHLITRGIKTLALRMRQQCSNAHTVATWLSEQPQVAQVYYPGLPSHPQHKLATQTFGGLFGAMVSFDLCKTERDVVFRFIDTLRLILPATSLGDIYTLATLPFISSHRDLTPEQRAERGIGDGLVRLSIGIEEVHDIIADLRTALQTAIPTAEH